MQNQSLNPELPESKDTLPQLSPKLLSSDCLNNVLLSGRPQREEASDNIGRR